MQLLTLTWLLIAIVGAQYELQSNFSGLTFFDNFAFYTSWDPTFGYVHYVDQAFAQEFGMINITDSSVSWGVDTTQILNPNANLGRLSIRLVTLQSWTHGLFILDLVHMPSNVCGVWPALWMLGSGVWPTGGEIDIIEYVNDGVNNLMALHTSESCSVAGADELGTLVTSDCAAGAGYTGCTVSATQPNNTGDTFNANGGGVYAWEWTSTAIRIWFFPRNAIPASVISGIPNVDEFGTPTANFEGTCDIDVHFSNASMIFDVDFCGSYAGNVWQSNGCPMLDPVNGWSSCNEYVALNPSAFDETFWEVNYLNVYQLSSGATPSPASSLSSVTPAISMSTAVSIALSGAMGRTTSPTMSLAGTVPTDTVGTFSETSSVLSVLSSLSPESAASTSSAISSSSGITAAPTSGTPLISSGASLPPVAPPCTGTISTSNVYITVVATITAGGIAARETPNLGLRWRGIGAAQDWDEFDRCNFEIYQVQFSERRVTGYACTLTRLEILNGELITETAVASTAMQSSTALMFNGLLSIDDIAIETLETKYFTPIEDFAFTGSFVPSGTSTSMTTLTAYPKMPTGDARKPRMATLLSKRSIERDENIDGAGTVTKTSTSYITVSNVDDSRSPTSTKTPTESKSAESPKINSGTLLSNSLLVAIALII